MSKTNAENLVPQFQQTLAECRQLYLSAAQLCVEQQCLPQDKSPEEFIRLMDEHNHTIAKMKKPVIASVKGYALANAAGLSFIGLGVRPPTPEWGIMVAEGAQFIVSGEWWLALFPGLALMLAVLTFNLMGDGLRDIVDPAQRT